MSAIDPTGMGARTAIPSNVPSSSGRDGSPVNRQGLTSGAPDAIQVSDRFHLCQGLSIRVQQIATAHRGCLPAAIPDSPPRLRAPLVVERSRPRTYREVACWIVTPPGHRNLETTERLQRLLQQYPELDHTHILVRAFATIFDTIVVGRLSGRLDQATESGLPALASLANVIRDDLPAVQQAITSPYSPASTKAASPT